MSDVGRQAVGSLKGRLSRPSRQVTWQSRISARPSPERTGTSLSREQGFHGRNHRLAAQAIVVLLDREEIEAGTLFGTEVP
jgi:hypothetical protein